MGNKQKRVVWVVAGAFWAVAGLAPMAEAQAFTNAWQTEGSADNSAQSGGETKARAARFMGDREVARDR